MLFLCFRRLCVFGNVAPYRCSTHICQAEDYAESEVAAVPNLVQIIAVGEGESSDLSYIVGCEDM